MINKDDILRALDAVVHPEAGLGLSEGGFVKEVSADGERGRIDVVLNFRRTREPFAASLCRQASETIGKVFPTTAIAVSVDTRKPGLAPSPENDRRLPGVGKIVAVASGKGGVGKSTVCAHLAVALAAEGYRVGVLDADIYGPSQPQLFGVGGYLPPAESRNGAETIVPAESMGVKVMSIGFFIGAADALVWRGPMATNALRQLIRQTVWGALDYLFVDLPPGTGDVHLSVVQELELDGAVIVSTPQSLAVADVRRGVEMFRSEGIGVPVLGIIENMAWFTPAELPNNRYYIFGEGGTRRFAETEGIDFLGDIPIVQSAMEGGERVLYSHGIRPEVASCYVDIARKVVDKLDDRC